MPLGENINRYPLSATRNFLIVPSFNPERRHSWENIASHTITRNPHINSSIIITNADSIR